jgi:hypothetical protein
MQPLAQALDILQAENKAYMGYLLPVLYMLQDKLKQKRDAAEVCAPLIDALLAGICRRFSTIMEEPEMIAAAILHPKFCKTWTNDTSVLEKGKLYFLLSFILLPCLYTVS